jgi:hypothetical protein
VQKQGLWFTKVQGREAVFNYLPNDVIDIDLSNHVLNRLTNLVEIDTTSDFNNSFKEYIALAEHQMALTLGNFNIYVRTGFTTENQFGMPIITCRDATLNVPVIYFKEGNETKIYLRDNCIIAEAREEFDFLKIKDRLLYNILGILR